MRKNNQIAAIRENKALSSYVVTNVGFERLLRLLDKCTDETLLHYSLQLINQVFFS